jgi:hypothetical protein
MLARRVLFAEHLAYPRALALVASGKVTATDPPPSTDFPLKGRKEILS